MFHDAEFIRTIQGKKDCKEVGLPCGKSSMDYKILFGI